MLYHYLEDNIHLIFIYLEDKSVHKQQYLCVLFLTVCYHEPTMYLKFVRKCHTIILVVTNIIRILTCSYQKILYRTQDTSISVTFLDFFATQEWLPGHTVSSLREIIVNYVAVPSRSIVSYPLSFSKSNGRSDDSSSEKLTV